MRIFVFADGVIGLNTIKFLKKKGENIIGVAVHPKKYQNLFHEIKKAYNKDILVCGKKITSGKINKIKKLKPDVILVAYWRFLLEKQIIEIPKLACVNFHLGYLPFNRGANPNVWSIIDGSVAGSTIHKINKDIDTGDIICQKKTKHNLLDTGKSLHDRTIEDFNAMLKKNWDKIKIRKFSGQKQNILKGNTHYRKQFKKLSKIDLKKKYLPLDLFNILRAKMFKPYQPAYFVYKRKRYFVEIKIKK
jgi:methionyl-tRNA formyltransferase